MLKAVPIAVGRLVRCRAQLRDGVADQQPGHANQHGNLGHRLEQLNPVLLGHDAPQPGNRVELAEFRVKVLGHKQPASRDQGKHHHQQAGQQQRREYFHKQGQVVTEDQAQVLLGDFAGVKVQERNPEALLQPLVIAGKHHPQDQQGGNQRDGGGQVLGTGDLAVFTALAQLLGRCVFGFFLGAVVRHRVLLRASQRCCPAARGSGAGNFPAGWAGSCRCTAAPPGW